MTAAEFAGSLIAPRIAESPDTARRLLEVSYTAVRLMGATDRRQTYAGAVERFNGKIARTIVEGLHKPERAVLVNVFMPTEILQTMGLTPLFPEGISVYVANTHCAEPFADAAEEHDVPESFCSYHKIMVGMEETGVLPSPALIAHTTLACDANQVSFRRLAERYGVSRTVIDVPRMPSEDAVKCVEDQLYELTARLEDQLNVQLDIDKLRAVMQRSAQTVQNVNDYLDVRGKVSLPTSLTGELMHMMSTHLYLGTQAALRFTGETLEYACKAPAASTSDKPRVFWLHTLPNWQTSMRDIFDGVDSSIEIVGNDMALDYDVPADPADPFGSMARRIVYSSFNGSGKRRIENALHLAQRAGAQGAIVFCHWGCKQTLGLSQLAKRAFEEAGLPCLVLDGDGCDPRNVSDGQMVTRVNAFAEQLRNMGACQ